MHPSSSTPSAAPTIGESIGESIAESIKSALLYNKTGSFIDKDEAKMMTSDLKKSERASFKATIFNKSTLAEPRVADLKAITWSSPKDLTTKLETLTLTKIDHRLASTIFACLKPKDSAPCVALLMAATEMDSSLALSGVRMLEFIDNIGNKQGIGKAAKLKEEFDNQAFFACGKDEVTSLVSGAKLLKEIDALPSEFTSAHYAKHELILGKIPHNVANDHWAAQLKWQLGRAMRNDEDPPWTPETLIGEIASELEAYPSDTLSARKGYVKEMLNDGGERARKLEGKTLRGTIARPWINDKYTFIKFKDEGGKDVFLHKSNVNGQKPMQGDKVEFMVANQKIDGQNREHAINVKKITEASVRVAQIQTEEDTEENTEEEEQIQGQQIIINRSFATVVR